MIHGHLTTNVSDNDRVSHVTELPIQLEKMLLDYDTVKILL